jgi:hypothetical protein
MKQINLVVRPRETVTKLQFLSSSFPQNSIALDGFIHDSGPFLDLNQRKLNRDHHFQVERSATMSTCMQVYLAIKQGLFSLFGGTKPTVYINDVDQDTALAVWLLEYHHLFVGSSTIPNISRLVYLTDKLDITAGAYPVSISDNLLQTHAWVFKPYNEFRTSGLLFTSNAEQMLHNLELTMARITQLMMGQAEMTELDTRHEVFWEDGIVKIIHEIGGNEARYFLYSQGMKAHISLVTKRPDERYVWVVGKSSPYIQFDVSVFEAEMNKRDTLPDGKPLPAGEQAGGSDTIIGSSRLHGSALNPEDMKDIYLYLKGL